MNPHSILVSSKYVRTFMRVSLFGHMTQGLWFYSLSNIKSTWNPFKCENLDNSYGGGDFFACVCNYASIISWKNRNAKNEYISFYR
jgi:hypothetical protein